MMQIQQQDQQHDSSDDQDIQSYEELLIDGYGGVQCKWASHYDGSRAQ